MCLLPLPASHIHFESAAVFRSIWKHTSRYLFVLHMCAKMTNIIIMSSRNLWSVRKEKKHTPDSGCHYYYFDLWMSLLTEMRPLIFFCIPCSASDTEKNVQTDYVFAAFRLIKKNIEIDKLVLLIIHMKKIHYYYNNKYIPTCKPNNCLCILRDQYSFFIFLCGFQLWNANKS